MKPRKPERSLCGLCDATYDPNDKEEAATHHHPEPQSGDSRDAWLKSRLPYERWIEETEEGKQWLQWKRDHGRSND